ncbi:hypothetical protein E2P81_ATG03178 [Venturia nashicola]|uniref:BZIP domain-containing protein n=1 Tax=Venturia nashicola TaxID=86259 RepID=A0A4Z1PMZ9_9PEZI|nr:hypothetical protein E6O75_ATG03250 [Venturia nashicola]TLD36289.1 hypothetical protein E2P81_ATG03178 [Venturia nashicola]
MEYNNQDFWSPPSSYSSNAHLYEFPPDLSTTSSINASPTMSEFEMFPSPLYSSSFSPIPDDLNFNYPMPLTPSDFGSADEQMYSPRPTTAMPMQHSLPEKTHATSGRRRAQNRAAQRAFRERKEKHARDLEVQLNELTTKYQSLETSHAELTAAYDKLQKTLSLLTDKEEDEGGNGSTETLRKFLSILHGEMKIKAEKEGKE